MPLLRFLPCERLPLGRCGDRTTPTNAGRAARCVPGARLRPFSLFASAECCVGGGRFRRSALSGVRCCVPGARLRPFSLLASAECCVGGGRFRRSAPSDVRCCVPGARLRPFSLFASAGCCVGGVRFRRSCPLGRSVRCTRWPLLAVRSRGHGATASRDSISFRTPPTPDSRVSRVLVGGGPTTHWQGLPPARTFHAAGRGNGTIVHYSVRLSSGRPRAERELQALAWRSSAATARLRTGIRAERTCAVDRVAPDSSGGAVANRTNAPSDVAGTFRVP
jgi:hypothetical protein